MSDDDAPKQFTEAQRELFQTVAKLNRAKPDDFAEADLWIDTKPPTAVEERQRYRQQVRDEAAERRRRKDRSRSLHVPGEMVHEWRRWKPKDETQRQELANVLAGWRRDYARNVRHRLKTFDEKIREEVEHGPLKPHELIGLAANSFIRPSDPIVFDAMDPLLKAQWARRLLRVVWVLTDTVDLSTTKLAWLREWTWGEHRLEFIGDWPDGECRPVPRLWSRTTVLDEHLSEWEELTRHALRALEEAEPGATVIPATAARPVIATIGALAEHLRRLDADVDAALSGLTNPIERSIVCWTYGGEAIRQAFAAGVFNAGTLVDLQTLLARETEEAQAVKTAWAWLVGQRFLADTPNPAMPTYVRMADALIRASEATSSATPPRAGGDDAEQSAQASRAATVAGQQYALAVEKSGNSLTDDEAYTYMREHVTDSPDDMPVRETWKRYLRADRKARGEQKNLPRRQTRAPARSVVPVGAADAKTMKPDESG